LPSSPAKPRILANLAPGLSAAFHAAVARVAPRIEAQLGPQVHAERLADVMRLSNDGTGWLAPWEPARAAFREKCRVLARDLVMASTDVRDCYGSIEPETVAGALVLAGCHPSEVGPIVSLLFRLQREGVRGLPIGPPASAVLANAVLTQTDRALAGSPFLRWVDDYVVFAPTVQAAERLLGDLQASLAEAGLVLAPEKTFVGCKEVATSLVGV